MRKDSLLPKHLPATHATGEDSLGKFICPQERGAPGYRACSCCGADIDYPACYVVYCRGYPRLPEDLDWRAASVLKKRHGVIGVNCGCYARLHRQVAHIVESIKRRR